MHTERKSAAAQAQSRLSSGKYAEARRMRRASN